MVLCSPIAFPHRLSVQIFNQLKSSRGEIVDDVILIESRNPRFAGLRYQIGILVVWCLRCVLGELRLVNISEYKFASRGTASCHCTQGCQIGLTCQVHRNAEPREECFLVFPGSKSKPKQTPNPRS